MGLADHHFGGALCGAHDVCALRKGEGGGAGHTLGGGNEAAGGIEHTYGLTVGGDCELVACYADANIVGSDLCYTCAAFGNTNVVNTDLSVV